MRVNSIFAVLFGASMLAIPQIAVADSVEVVQEPAIEQLFERGNAARDAENHAEAERIWREVIRLTPNDAEAYNNLGHALYSQGKREEAIEAYQQTIRIDPDNAKAYYNLGILLSQQGKFEEAIEALQQSIRLNPDDALAYTNLGLTRFEQGKFEEAIAALQQAIRLNPDDANPYGMLGMALSEQGKFEEAIEAYQQAVRLNPNFPHVYNILAIALSEQGKLEEAIEAYQQALRINPNDTNAYHLLGIWLSQQGKFEEAIAALQQALRINPNDGEVYSTWGLVLLQQGKLEEALEKCQQTLRLPEQVDGHPASSHTVARHCVGLIYLAQEKYEEAIAEFQKAIDLDESWHFPYNNLVETKRLLSLQRNPQPTDINDRAWLPDNPNVSLLRSVVRVIADTPDGSQTGTGWVIKREENRIWILTARHVIYHEETRQISHKIAVDFYSDPPEDRVHRRQEAKLVKIPAEDDLDLVLLEVTNPPEDVQPLPVLSQQMNRGDRIRIIGHPIPGSPWTMVSGEIRTQDLRLLQIDATVATGNSGGPVLNEQGQVVGMLIEVSNLNDRETAGFAFAYSLIYLKVWLQQWEIF